MVLLIDNYDSFSYNLYQLVGEICQEAERQREQEGHEQAECGCGQEGYGKAQGERGQAGEKDPGIRVIRNDEMTVEDIRTLAPDRIILSPGPGRPEDGCDKKSWQQDSHIGGLPRSPGHMRCLWRHRHLCKEIDARKAVHGTVRSFQPAL